MKISSNIINKNITQKISFKIAFFFAIFLFVFILGTQNVSAATIGKPTNYLGILAYYTFDGKDMNPNVRDLSGNAKHCTLNGQSATTTTIGKTGQALVFDNTDDYLSCGLMTEFNGAINVTVSMWINPKTLAGADYIFFRQGAGDPGNNRIGIDLNGGSPIFYSAKNGNAYGIGAAETITTNRWQHLVMVYDGNRSTNATKLRVFVDGVEKTLTFNGTIASVWPDMTADNITFYIGSLMYLTPGQFYDGKMDDFRIYNRSLSTSEVNSLYNSTATKFNKSIPLSNGLIAYWTFDGKDMNPNVRDISGLGNHGTLLGQAATTTAIGKVGQALKFDGVDDYVTANTAAFFNSVSMWIKPNNVNQTLFDVFGGSISINSGQLTDNTACAAGSTTYYVNGVSTSTVSTGIWNHVVINCSGFFDSAIASISFGKSGASYYTGLMDDIRIYNRNLTTTEILQLYNAGK